VTLASTLSLVPVIIGFCHRRKILDFPSQRKTHPQPTPHLGGVAIFISCVIAWTVGYVLWPGILSGYGKLIIWLSLGGIVIFGLGLVDDLKPIRFRDKILIESLVGLLLIAAGVKIRLLFIPGWHPLELGWASWPLTLLWFLGLLNSINLIDGLDGLAAGVSAIAAATLLVVGLHYQAGLVAFLMAGALSACLGFLRYNFIPAKIFLGDSGSLFLGYLFAISSLTCPIKSYTAVAMFVPLVALGVPVLETVSSFVRRTAGLKRFYAADNLHIYNLLIDLGLSQKTAVLLLYTVSLFFSGLSLLLMTAGHRLILPIFSLVLVLTLAASLCSYILGYKLHTRSKRMAV